MIKIGNVYINHGALRKLKQKLSNYEREERIKKNCEPHGPMTCNVCGDKFPTYSQCGTC